jgi:hypothetical protein
MDEGLRQYMANLEATQRRDHADKEIIDQCEDGASSHLRHVLIFIQIPDSPTELLKQNPESED